jgi:hypothetical protein
MHRIVVPLVALAILVGGGVVALATGLVAADDAAERHATLTEIPTDEQIAELASQIGPVEVHRSESCGCCGGHAEHLVAAGFEVDDHVHADEDAVPAMKRDLGIPDGVWSCHTTMVDGYAIEGHVPADVIAALLLERPDVDGIALPGMPAGSPGMPGEQADTWSFASFVDGVETGVFAER